MTEATIQNIRSQEHSCHTSHSSSAINVGLVERICSIVSGCTLGTYGLIRGGVTGWGMAAAGGALVWRGTTGTCQVYEVLGISTAEHSPHASLASKEGIRVETSVIVSCAPQEAFQFWRTLSNLPTVFTHLKQVQETSQNQSHWVADGPLGTEIEWDAEIITDRPGELISWKSLEGAAVSTAGSVRFERLGDSDTRIHLLLRYSPPAGQLGASIAEWMGQSPQQQIEADLQRLKRTLEAKSSQQRSGHQRSGNAHHAEAAATESHRRPEPSTDGLADGRLHIGEMVWNSAGTRRGKVIGVDQLPMGTIEPSNRLGLTYSVEWDDTHKGEGQLRYQDLRAESRREDGSAHSRSEHGSKSTKRDRND